MAIVADYSAGKPGAKALKIAGFSGAVRYIGFSDPNDPRTPKCTTKAELDDFTAEDLGMALVFESRADDWRGGWQAGFTNYLVARRHATAIGFPADRPIYMAVDSEVVGAQAHAVMYQYLRGARDAAGGDINLVGVYGQFSVCQYLFQASEAVVAWYWQCRAWSGTPISYFVPRHLFQRVGTVNVGRMPCDINDVAQDDWGQHTEDGMAAISQDLENAIWEIHRAVWSGDYAGTTPPDGLPALHRHVNFIVDTVLTALEALGHITLSPEDRAALAESLATLVPSAETVAQATVAEFKKEGN